MAWGLRQRDDAAQDMDIFDACISGINKGKTNFDGLPSKS